MLQAGRSGGGSITLGTGAARGSTFRAPDDIRLGRFGAGDSIVIRGTRIAADIVQLPGGAELPLRLDLAGLRERSAQGVDLRVDVGRFQAGRLEVVDGLLSLMEQAQHDVLIVSPYVVPGPRMMALYEQLRRRGVRIRMLTNSLASNDAPAAHAGYLRYRGALLALVSVGLVGVQGSVVYAQRLLAISAAEGVAVVDPAVMQNWRGEATRLLPADWSWLVWPLTALADLGTLAAVGLTWRNTAASGGREWAFGSEERVKSMYQVEHDELFAGIRAGKFINDGESAAHSTLMALLAREAAYTGKRLTWKQLLASNQNLAPKEYDWNAQIETPPVPNPGYYKLA